MIYLTYLKTSHFKLKSDDVEPMLNSDNEGVFLLRDSCTSDIWVYKNKTCRENYLEQDVSCWSTNVSYLSTREKQNQLNIQSTQSSENEEDYENESEDIPTERNELTISLHNGDTHFVMYKYEHNTCRTQLLKGTLKKKISKIRGEKKITKQENTSKSKHQLSSIKNSFKGKTTLNKEKCEKLIRSNCSKNSKRGFIKQRKIRKNVYPFEKKNFLNTVENILALQNSAVHLKAACENFSKFCKDNIESANARKCLRRVSKSRASKGGNHSMDILDVTEKYAGGDCPYVKCIEYNTRCRKRDEARRLNVLIKKVVVEMEYYTCTKRKSRANVRGKKGSIISKNAKSNAPFHKRNNTNDIRRGRSNKRSFLVVHEIVMDVYNVDMHCHDNCTEVCKGTPSWCVLFVECCPLKYNVATTNCNTKLRSIPNINQKEQEKKIKKNKNKKNKNNKGKKETIANVVDLLNHLSSTVPQIKNNGSFIFLEVSTIMCKSYNVRGSIMEFVNSTNKKYNDICRIKITRIISIPYCMQRDTHQCIQNDIYYELYQAVYLARHCYVIFQEAIMSSFCNVTHQESFLCVQNCLENCITQMGHSFFQRGMSTFAIFRAVSNAISISTTIRNKLPFPKPLFFKKYTILVTQYQNIINYAIFFLDLCEYIITYHFKKKKILLRTKEKISLLLYYFGDQHGVVKYQRKHFFHHICSERCSKQEKYCEKDFISWLSDPKVEVMKSEVEVNLPAYLKNFKDKKGKTERSHQCIREEEILPHQNSPGSSSNHHTTLYYAMKKLILYFCHYFAAPSDIKIKYRHVCKKRHKLKKLSSGASECIKNFLHIHVINTLTGFLKRDFVKVAYTGKGQGYSLHGPSDQNASSIYSTSSGSSCSSTHERSLKNQAHIGLRVHTGQHRNDVLYTPNCTLKSEERGMKTCTSDHTKRNKSNNSDPRMLDESEGRHPQYLKFQVKGKLALHVLHRRDKHKMRCDGKNYKPTNNTHKPNDSRRNIIQANPNSSDHYYMEKEIFTKLYNNVVRPTNQMENKRNYTQNYTHANLNNFMNNRNAGNHSNANINIIRDQITHSIERSSYHRNLCTGCQNSLHHNMNHMTYCNNGQQIRWQTNPNSFMHGSGNYGCGNGFNTHSRSNYSIGRSNRAPQYGNGIFVKSGQLPQNEEKDMSYYFGAFFNNSNNSYFSRTVDRNNEINCTHRYTQPHQNNAPPNCYVIPNGVYTFNNINLNKQNKLCKMCKSTGMRGNEHYYHTNRIFNSFEGFSKLRKDPNVRNTNGGHPANNYINEYRFDEQCLSNNALKKQMGRGMITGNCSDNLPNANTHALNNSNVPNSYRNCSHVNRVRNIFCMCGAMNDHRDNEFGGNESGDNEGGNNRSGNDEGSDNQGDKESNEGGKKSGTDNNKNNNNNGGRNGKPNGDNSNQNNNKEDDNEQEGNDQNRRGCNKQDDCSTTGKKKKSKKKKQKKK
ncbi:Uncharacterized protein PCOAH_00018950 [Plasmodium coatneyi]|uniref:Uncharacterized protein n=1 Tax=Plasmodium coatneyi TaxID=208452 RepID=A0A1B1DXH2_9APIC|nr:Uncharacterized protein PCOAH_00018950 [Plasmodium coatneyi]ANQ07295.1 Uncharacterized protein PCOAH_00018950 [Plasmodium coatneyi]